MAMSPQAPGVYVDERDFTGVISSEGTNAAATVGDFRWGPVDVRTSVSTTHEMVETFGKPTDRNYVDWFSGANFLSYSGMLWLVRVVDADAMNATGDGQGLLVKNETAFNYINDGTTHAAKQFIAKYPGDLGNTLAISMADANNYENWEYANEFDFAPGTSEYAHAQGAKNDELHVVVIDRLGDFTGVPGAILERYAFVSKGRDARALDDAPNFYGDVINTKSNYVWWIGVPSADQYADPQTQPPTIVQPKPIEALLQGDVAANTVTITPPENATKLSITWSKGGQSAAHEATFDTTTSAWVDNTTNPIAGSDATIDLATGKVVVNMAGLDQEGVIVTATVDGKESVAIFGDTEHNSTPSVYKEDWFTKVEQGTNETVFTPGDAANDYRVEYIDESDAKKSFVVSKGTNWTISGNESYVTVDADTGVVKLAHEHLKDGKSFLLTHNNAITVKVAKTGTFTAPTLQQPKSIPQPAITKTPWGTNLVVRTVASDYQMLKAGTGSSHKGSFLALSGGKDGGIPTAADYLEGWAQFQSTEEIDVGILIAGQAGGAAAHAKVVQYLIDNICEARGDCVVAYSPNRDDTFNKTQSQACDNILATRERVGRSSSYAIMDSGWKLMFDVYNNKNRWIPLNSDVAGLMAATERDYDAWWSPAGFNRGKIKNVIALSFNPNGDSRLRLYKRQVNSVVTFVGEGTILYGDKTQQAKQSAFQYINVRRLFITLKKSIAKQAKYLLFEFNDAVTQAYFESLVNPYMGEVKGRRGVTDYIVDGHTFNTPQVIDEGGFVGMVACKPNRSIQWVSLRMVAVRQSIKFEEIYGKAA